MKGSSYSRISNSSSARASLNLPYIGNLLPSRVISYSVNKTVLSVLTVQYAKAEPTLAFHAASPGQQDCIQRFWGHEGFIGWSESGCGASEGREGKLRERLVD